MTLLHALKNEKASLQDMISAHVELEERLPVLQDGYQTAYDEVVALQVEELAGAPQSKKGREFKERLNDLTQKIDAAKSAMQSLRSKIKSRIVQDATDFIERSYPEQCAACQAERQKLHREFLRAYARALAIEEQIEGRPVGSQVGSIEGGSPSMRFKELYLRGEDRKFLYEEVVQLRRQLPEDFVHIERRGTELYLLTQKQKKILENPDAEVKRALENAGSKWFAQEEPETEDSDSYQPITPIIEKYDEETDSPEPDEDQSAGGEALNN